MDNQKTIGWLRERIKNHDSECGISLVINGIEHPLTDAHFHLNPEQLLLVAKPPAGCIEVISEKIQNAFKGASLSGIDAFILNNGPAKKIESIKEHRRLTNSGLLEAKIYVEKVLGQHK
mgnify:CR=1 FL=1